MKVLFLLLLMGNLGFYLWQTGWAQNPSQGQEQVDESGERIVLLSEVGSVPKLAVSAKPDKAPQVLPGQEASANSTPVQSPPNVEATPEVEPHSDAKGAVPAGQDDASTPPASRQPSEAVVESAAPKPPESAVVASGRAPDAPAPVAAMAEVAPKPSEPVPVAKVSEPTAAVSEAAEPVVAVSETASAPKASAATVTEPTSKPSEPTAAASADATPKVSQPASPNYVTRLSFTVPGVALVKSPDSISTHTAPEPAPVSAVATPPAADKPSSSPVESTAASSATSPPTVLPPVVSPVSTAVPPAVPAAPSQPQPAVSTPPVNPSSTPNTSSAKCQRLGPYLTLPSAQTVAKSMEAPGRVVQTVKRPSDVVTGYVIYHPAGPTAEAAEASRNMLMENGFADAWMMDRGPGHYAVALVMINNQIKAQDALVRIRAKGIAAEMKPRVTSLPRWWVEVQETADVEAAQVNGNSVVCD